MNIYLLSQGINTGYDTYDSCVVAAINEEQARSTHPDTNVTHETDGVWMGTTNGGGREYEILGMCESWVKHSDIDKISVKLIGVASDDVKAGVICASFNAG